MRTVIDYDALAEAYRRSLTSVLRGFRPGDFTEAFLETWVPDEDDVRSVQGIFEAAAGSNLPRLAVRIGGATLRRVTPAALEKMATRFGVVTTSRDGDDVVIEVALAGASRAAEPVAAPVAAAKRARGTAPSPPVPPMSERTTAYDEPLLATGAFTHEGVADVAGTVRVAVDHLGATLDVCVDARHVIVSARHRGGGGDTPAVLEALCRTIEALPIREAADHGAARLELALRGRGGRRVVPGIVSPDNADPRIGACVSTLRTLLAEYARRAGSPDVKNEYTPPLRAEWAHASPAERAARARDALRSVVRELGLEASAVDLADIHGDARVVLAFTAEVPASDRPSLIFEIERALKERLDGGVAVYLEEMADKNRIRRLVKPAEAPR